MPISNFSAFWAQIQQGYPRRNASSLWWMQTRMWSRLIDAMCRVSKVKSVFEHLNFRYTDKEPILTDFNLHIQTRRESRTGRTHRRRQKSSIAKLIARFYEFQEGRLLIDGMDVRTFDLQQYRRQLGIVSQVPFLFSGTVADNIRYAVPDVKESEMLEMAKKIGDGEWLDTCPKGCILKSANAADVSRWDSVSWWR
jgi:ATP-binding cassette subfamily B protein